MQSHAEHKRSEVSEFLLINNTDRAFNEPSLWDISVIATSARLGFQNTQLVF